MASQTDIKDVTDDALLTLVGNYDREAMQERCLRFQPRLYRFLVRLLKNEAMAEDILHETFLQVWNSAENFEGRSSAVTWIFSVARNTGLRAMRKKREYLPGDDDLPDIQDDALTPEQTANQSSIARVNRCPYRKLYAHE